jgi:AraC-like DNA-binding protein
MSFYTTPLQFGYFLSVLLFLVFLFRSYHREVVSDRFLALLMLIFALEMQDYTFGFSGINFLWNELNGFPREVALLLGPVMYFYLKAQISLGWHLKRRDYWHFAPWGIYFLFNFIIFLSGDETVKSWQTSGLVYYYDYVLFFIRWLSLGYYFYHSIRLYKSYRRWIDQSFSDIEAISLNWFRNFIYLMLLWVSFREIMHVLDHFLDLSFYQDWWWNLALVAVSIYVGLSGMAQKEASNIAYDSSEVNPSNLDQGPSNQSHIEYKQIIERLDSAMRTERLYLQPQLNLRDLAKQLKVPSGTLSAAINNRKKNNFNDYINALRVEEFLELARKEGNKNYTLLSLAFDCGFNSKATFNRAFKKQKACSPREYLNKKDE